MIIAAASAATTARPERRYGASSARKSAGNAASSLNRVGIEQVADDRSQGGTANPENVEQQSSADEHGVVETPAARRESPRLVHDQLRLEQPPPPRPREDRGYGDAERYVACVQEHRGDDRCRRTAAGVEDRSGGELSRPGKGRRRHGDRGYPTHSRVPCEYAKRRSEEDRRERQRESSAGTVANASGLHAADATESGQVPGPDRTRRGHGAQAYWDRPDDEGGRT